MEEFVLGLVGVFIPVLLIVGGFTVAVVKMRGRQQIELLRLQASQGDPLFGLGVGTQADEVIARLDRLEAKVDRIAQTLAVDGAASRPTRAASPRRMEPVEQELPERERSMVIE